VLLTKAWLLDLTSSATGNSRYSGVPVQNATCPFHLRVFPSQTTKNNSETNQPVLFTVCAVLIFAFTSLIFVCYDWMVERRQKKLMTTAAQSSAIVSSLFPETVRDRLFRTSQDDTQSTSTTTKNRKSNVSSHPIADFYPHATVLFADMYVLFVYDTKPR
jgi:hypothetical protein